MRQDRPVLARNGFRSSRADRIDATNHSRNEQNVSQARISFVVPADPASVAELLGGGGWTLEGEGDALDSISGRAGTRMTVSYGGTYPILAVEAVVGELARHDAAYVAVAAARFDPAMDMTPAALIEVDRSWNVDGRRLRLPLGFRNPGIDERTLVAAGMGADEALACLASLSGAAMAPARAGRRLDA
jgi:hypothetical protein